MLVRLIAPIILLSSTAWLGGACAPWPEQIAAAPVPPQLHGGLSCPQLAGVQADLNRRLAWLSAEQTQSAMDDTVGVLFTLRPLASLSGGNLQDQVALAKGEVDLVNGRLARDCRG
jgi:hypothetical protein